MSKILLSVDNYMILAKLKELKAQKNLTNQQIADLSGVPLSTVTRVFNGQTDNPNIGTIEDIVKGMGFSLDDVTGIKQTEEKYSPDDNLIQLYKEMIRTKDKYIRFLSGTLVAIVVLLLIMLLLDLFVLDVGYIRR